MGHRFLVAVTLVALFAGWGYRLHSPATSARRLSPSNLASAFSVQRALVRPLAFRRPAGGSQAPAPSPEEYFATLKSLAQSDKEAALAWVFRGDAWYGKEGSNVDAREAMRVTLLVDLGRMEEARSATYAFLERFPKSEYRHLVQGVTGIHPRPGRPAPLAP